MIVYYVNELSTVFDTGVYPGFYRTNFLTLGNSYEGELTPTLYDPKTLDVVPPSYVIKCDDGMFRKFNAEFFITEQEWKQMDRENKLNEIGI